MVVGQGRLCCEKGGPREVVVGQETWWCRRMDEDRKEGTYLVVVPLSRYLFSLCCFTLDLGSW